MWVSATQDDTPPHPAAIAHLIERSLPQDEENQVSLVRTVLEFADSLSSDSDEGLDAVRLVTTCADLLQGAEASLMLTDGSGELRDVAGTTEPKRVLDRLQLERSEGPSIDVYRSGRYERTELDQATDERWPFIAPLARSIGYVSVHSFPLSWRSEVLGVLSVSSTAELSLGPVHALYLRALAESATIGLLHHRAYSAARERNEHLQLALSTRISIEQAKGVVSAGLGVTPSEAFTLLRRYARRSNLKLDAVSRVVVEGELAVDSLF